MINFNKHIDKIIKLFLFFSVFFLMVLFSDSTLYADSPGTNWIKSPVTGNFYTLTPRRSWMDAEAWAQGWGGHLVTLTSWAEELWIKETFGSNELFYIGFNVIGREHHGDNFVWSSGHPVVYTNWAEGEPNNYMGVEDVTVMNWGDHWNDLPKDGHSSGVAEIMIEDELGLVIEGYGDFKISGAPAKKGDLVRFNDLMQTSINSLSKIMMPAEQGVRAIDMGSNSEVKITSESTPSEITMEFIKGKLRGIVRDLPKDALKIRMPQCVIGPRGTEWILEGDESYNIVTVLDGSIEVSTPDGTDSVLVEKNNELQVTAEGLGEPYPIDPDEVDKWWEVDTSGVDINTGWNLIGLPLDVSDDDYKSLYPNAMDGTLFSFNGSYNPQTDLQGGTGYWLRFPAEETVDIIGLPIDELTIELTTGWNMISGLSEVVPLESVQQDPEGILMAGTLYEFVGAYNPSTELEPGKGYWIRANADGQISMSAAVSGDALAKTATQSAGGYDTTILESFDRIDIRNAEGVEHTLYFGSTLPEGVQRERYSLPPLPPGNTFDVRFTDGYYLSEKAELAIFIQGESYPLELTFHSATADEVVEYIVTEMEGIEYRALSGESIELTEPDVRMIQVRRSGEATERALPEQYSLSQNYPNPFNPMTTIQYALPKDSYVKLEVFNMLGQRVQVLVDEDQEAGYYEVLFAGSMLPSGVYVYRITAGEFVGVKRFVYMK